MKKLNILDKYIVKQLIETFLISLVIFTSIIFATDAFITIVKQITEYGIPLHVAAILVILKLPSMLILTIPMGILLATLLTVNRMNNALEITILKACGIGLSRISKPILIFSVIAALFGFTVNEIIAPVASKVAKELTIMSIVQKNVPNGKKNFIFKEMKDNKLYRFFHIASVEKNELKNITVLDLSRKNTIQVIYAKHGQTATEESGGWLLENGVIYTIATSGKILNTAVFSTMNFDNTREAIEKLNEINETEMNYFELRKYLKVSSTDVERRIEIQKQVGQISSIEEEQDKRKSMTDRLRELKILLYEKLSLPITSIVFALIAIPLAITGPRAKFNRGLISSIIVLFIFYILRAIALSLGQNATISPVLAAWIPNIVLLGLGLYLYRKKAYFI